MYITIKSIKKTLGKFIELSDLYIGLPMLFIFLIMFAFTNLKIEALMFLGVCGFLMIPISISKFDIRCKVTNSRTSTNVKPDKLREIQT